MTALTIMARNAANIAVAIAVAALGACASTSPSATAGSDVYDPWEGANRDLFVVYKATDDYALVPAAKAYRTVTNKPVRRGVANFIDNMRSPVILANDLLQGEFKRAGTTFSRFAVNTLIGFYGTFDPAERLGFEQHNEDFGQTLAVWGVHPGPYMVLPFFGPTTVRDMTGRAIDAVIDPFTWIEEPGGPIIGYTRVGGGALVQRERVIEALDDLEATSLDYYIALRSVYMQSRQREISNGRSGLDDLPDIDEFDVDFEESN